MQRKLSVTNLFTWRNSNNDDSAHCITSLHGTLYKMKRNSKVLVAQWNKRYCTIEGTYFRWYNSQESEICSGSIDLKAITAVRTYNTQISGSYCFTIMCPTRQMILRATSNTECEKWIRALLFQADLARGGDGTNIINRNNTGNMKSKIKGKSKSKAISLEEELINTMKELDKLEEDVRIAPDDIMRTSPRSPHSHTNTASGGSGAGIAVDKHINDFYQQAFAEDHSDEDDDSDEEKEEPMTEGHNYERNNSPKKRLPTEATNSGPVRIMPPSTSSPYKKAHTDLSSSSTPPREPPAGRTVSSSNSSPDRQAPKQRRDYDLETSDEDTHAQLTRPPQMPTKQTNRTSPTRNNTTTLHTDEPLPLPRGPGPETEILTTERGMVRDSSMNLPLFDSDDEDVPELDMVIKKTTRRIHTTRTSPSMEKSAWILGTSTDTDEHHEYNLNKKATNPVADMLGSTNKNISENSYRKLNINGGNNSSVRSGGESGGASVWHKEPESLSGRENNSSGVGGGGGGGEGGKQTGGGKQWAIGPSGRKTSVNAWIE